MNKNQVILADQVLTNIAHGYKRPESVGQLLFPTVPVSKTTGKIAKFGKESMRLFATRRLHNEDLNTLNAFGAGTTSYELTENQQAIRIETKDIEQGSDWINLETKATNDAVHIIETSKENEIATIAQATSSYASGNYTTLTSNYFNQTDVDPIKELLGYGDEIESLIAQRPNTMLLGKGVWKHFRSHPKIKAYFGTSNEQLVTLAKLSELLEIPNIAIGRGVYQATPDSALTEIWTNNIILTYTAPVGGGIDRTEYDPAFGFLLQKQGNPQVYKYGENSGTFQFVNAVDEYQAIVVGNESGFLIKNPIDPSVY